MLHEKQFVIDGYLHTKFGSKELKQLRCANYQTTKCKGKAKYNDSIDDAVIVKPHEDDCDAKVQHFDEYNLRKILQRGIIQWPKIQFPNVSIRLLKVNSQEARLVTSIFSPGWFPSLTVPKLKIHQIYAVRRDANLKFENAERYFGFHGSAMDNMDSILVNNLLPSNELNDTIYKTGSVYGVGVYFSWTSGDPCEFTKPNSNNKHVTIIMAEVLKEEKVVLNNLVEARSCDAVSKQIRGRIEFPKENLKTLSSGRIIPTLHEASWAIVG